MIKKIVTVIVLSATIGSVVARSSRKEVEIKSVKIKKIGTNLDIRFQAIVPAKAVKRNFKLTVVPVLYNGGNEHQLSPIVIKSRRVRIVEERNGISPLTNEIYAKQGKAVDYSAILPYEQWMNGASLRADKIIAGCCSEQYQRPELIASNMEFVKPFEPSIEEVYSSNAVDKRRMVVPQASEEVRSWAFTTNDMNVNYGIGETRIDPSLLNNKQVLTELVAVVRKLNTNKDTSLDKIEIIGYSSPDGARALNSIMAMNRAVSLKDYLQREISGLHNSIFKLENGGENWNGLRKVVAESYMDERSEVLHIIDNIPAEINYKTNSSRKKALMDLNGGRTWNYLFKNYFAQLRNACYIMVYYNQLTDAAADVINVAIQLIHDKQYDKALTLLLAHKDDSRAWNLIGVCYMMTDRLAEAKQSFEKASANGNEQAKLNLKQINESQY